MFIRVYLQIKCHSSPFPYGYDLSQISGTDPLKYRRKLSSKVLRELDFSLFIKCIKIVNIVVH